LVIGAKETKEAGALGYMAKALVQATMPHKNPGTVEAWGDVMAIFLWLCNQLIL